MIRFIFGLIVSVYVGSWFYEEFSMVLPKLASVVDQVYARTQIPNHLELENLYETRLKQEYQYVNSLVKVQNNQIQQFKIEYSGLNQGYKYSKLKDYNLGMYERWG